MVRRRTGTIHRLDGELKGELDRLLTEGRFTLAEITEHLRSLGADVSRSAVHRYSQHHEKIAADIRMTREMAQAIGQELDDVKGDSGRLIIESMQSLLLKARMQMAGDAEINPKDLGELARSAKDLQQALKLNVETEQKIRDRVLKEAVQAVDEVVSKSAGITNDTIEAIKARVLGLGR